MKITLKNSSEQTFTIITNATYPFDTPCIGENGKLYWLNRYNSDACFVDNEQLRYISPCKDKNGNHDHDTRRANKDKQGGLQGFDKAVNLPATRDTEGAHNDSRNAQKYSENGKKDHLRR